MAKNSSTGSQVDAFITQHLENGESADLLLTEILHKGQLHGYHKQDLWKQIVKLSAKSEVQKKWANWTQQSEREEIRLRLKTLNETDILDESLIKFILFFFRASDPVLYQLAAMIIGRELDNYPAFETYFKNFCEKRNTAYNSAILLNNQRSRRRIMLVMASYLYHGNRKLGISMPVPLNGAAITKEMSDSDISITFLCCALLLRGGFDDCKTYATEILDSRFKNSKELRDRNLVRNAGILIDELKTSGENIGEIYNLIFKKAAEQYNEGDDLAAKLQVLFVFDELMESSIHLNLSQNEQAFKNLPGKRLPRFLQLRLQHWREVTQKKTDIYKIQPGKIDSILDDALTLAESEDRELEYRMFTRTIQYLANERQWRTLHAEERVFRAFFVIEQSLNSSFIDDRELFLLFVSNGLIENVPGQSRRKSGKAVTGRILAAVVKQLIYLESSFTKKLFDTQLIHRLDEPDILPVLLPSDIDSEYLPILADALEHQVRFKLTTDSGFRPNHYLYLLTIRRPHSRFYRYLLELTRDREYNDIQGNVFPFSRVIEKLLAESSEKIPDFPENDMEHEQPLSFWAEIEKFRSDLIAISKLQDPVQLINELSNQLKGTGAEQVRGGMTLHDLLEIVQPEDSNWYQSGLFPLTGESGGQIIKRMDDIAAKIERKVISIQPSTLNLEAEFNESGQILLNLLDQLRDEILPLCGFSEMKISETVLNRAETELSSWMKVCSQASDIRFDDSENSVEKTRTRLAGFIASEKNEKIREKLLTLFWNSELNDCQSTDDPWIEKYELLLWAAGPGSLQFKDKELSSVWIELLEKEWINLLDEAAEANTEARVIQLIQEKEFSEIRSKTNAQNKLIEIKDWFYSRYDGLHAYQCNKHINNSKSGIANILSTGKEYFTHFAQVWVALLFGVIMMFDFGDPWTELAELGDLPGVLFAFLFGVAGTFIYVYSDLNKKTVHVKTDPFSWISVFGRVAVFLVATFLFTSLAVILFWYMFSSTDQVVHGPNAPLHLLSWTGFALFIGVFLGLIGRD